MSKPLLLTTVAAACFGTGGALTQGSLVLSGNSVNLRIEDEDFGLHIDRFTGVAWGLHELRSLTVGPSTSSAQYDLMLLDPDTASIRVEAHHICANPSGNRPRCYASGRFILTPSVETRVTLDLAFDYRLSGDPTLAYASFYVFDQTHSQTLAQEGDSVTSFFGPLRGTVTLSAETTLMPNTEYAINYHMDSDATGDFPSPIPATGDGVFLAEFTPIPEPATALLLFPALLFLRRRLLGHGMSRART